MKFAKTWTNKTFQEIAAEADISVKEVKAAWKMVKKTEEYKLGEEIVDGEIKKQLREFEMIKMELMKAWFDSGDNLESQKDESGYTSKGEIAKTTTESKGRNKDVSYLTEIRLINQSIQEILGIKKHMEVNLFQHNNNQFNIEGVGQALVPEEHNSFITGDDSDMPLKKAVDLNIPEQLDE